MNTTTYPIVAHAREYVDSDLNGRVEIVGWLSALMHFDEWECLVDTAGYSIGYWASAAVVDSEAHTYTVTDGETGEIKTLTADQLLSAMLRLAYDENANVTDSIAKYAREALTTGDYGDVDGEVADMVVQIAMHGEVVYG